MVVEKVFAVIAESTRRDILEALALESKAVGQLVDELGVSQPTVSKHLRVLREAGVVTMRAQGQKRFYGINTEPLVLVSTWLDSLGAGLGQSALEQLGVAPKGAAAKEVAGVNGTAAAGATAGGAPDRAAAAAMVPAPAKAGATVQAAPATDSAPASVAATPAERPAAAKSGVPAPVAPAASAAVAARELAIIGGDSAGTSDGGVPGQISRSVGRAANKAADLLANLPAFRRRKD